MRASFISSVLILTMDVALAVPAGNDLQNEALQLDLGAQLKAACASEDPVAYLLSSSDLDPAAVTEEIMENVCRHLSPPEVKRTLEKRGCAYKEICPPPIDLGTVIGVVGRLPCIDTCQQCADDYVPCQVCDGEAPGATDAGDAGAAAIQCIAW